jgi:hypothetical protein
LYQKSSNGKNNVPPHETCETEKAIMPWCYKNWLQEQILEPSLSTHLKIYHESLALGFVYRTNNRKTQKKTLHGSV